MADPRTSPIELVIFDCDGVLVDSEPIASEVLASALGEVGLTMGADEVHRAFVGLAMPAVVEQIESRAGQQLPADFVERLQRRTFLELRARLRPIPGIVEALDRLNFPACVASSGDPEKIRLTLGLTGLWPRFEGRTFSAAEVRRGKPHPDLFLHAAAGMRVAPSRCVVVEDSPHGIRAGLAAGMRVLGYAGDGDPALLESCGAIPLRRMSELPERIATLAGSD